jgi:hypothetical protein
MKAKVSGCDKCPANVDVLAMDEESGAPVRKRVCYFLKSSPADDGKKLRNCPFF